MNGPRNWVAVAAKQRNGGKMRDRRLRRQTTRAARKNRAIKEQRDAQ